MTQCRSCGAPIIWGVMEESGRKMPLDADGVTEPRVGLIAYSPSTEHARAINAVILEQAQLWAQHGITFHESHFATCPDAGEHRR